MPHGKLKVATVEDYDSDVSKVKPGTRREAKRRSTTSGPPKSLDRYRTAPRDGASDSGYSSHTSATQGSSASTTAAAAAAAMPPPPRPATVNPQGKSKPIIHRSDSQRSRPRAPSRSDSSSRPADPCNDPNCTDPNCSTIRNAERRRSASYAQYVQYASTPTQYTASPLQYQPQPQYQYQYGQVPQVQPSQTVPQLAAQPRPRSGSVSRQARPVSFNGYVLPSTYAAAQAGPPPSSSAYQTMQAQYIQMLQQQQQNQQYQQAYRVQAYGTTPPNQAVPLYTPISPTAPSPTTPGYPATPGLTRTFSARTGVASTAPTYDLSNVRYAAPRTITARQTRGRTSTMPGAFPTGEPDSSETESESEESEEYLSEEDERDRRSRARDSRLMSSSSQRRPSINKHYISAPSVPTQSSREMLHRNLRSETALEYVSSDNMDSDRTARAVVDRARTNYSNSTRSSRRPSLSTTASSDRTKSTNISSATSGMGNMVIEDRHGRKVAYLSKRDRDALTRRAHQQRLWEEEQERKRNIEAYQELVRGPQSPELTAENIRRVQTRGNPSVSGHSRKTSRSDSKSKVGSSGGAGVKLVSGGTEIHLYGSERVEVQTGEDGTQRVIVGGGSSSRGGDSAYYGSKSSSSRVGRSRGGSEAGGSKRRSRQIPEDKEDDSDDE